jgi:hypothetical protein
MDHQIEATVNTADHEATAQVAGKVIVEQTKADGLVGQDSKKDKGGQKMGEVIVTAPGREIDPKIAAEMRYYDLKRHWTKRIEPHLDDEELKVLLWHDMNELTLGRWEKKFKVGMCPRDVETCLDDLIARKPRFWKYVATGTSYWIVNFALRLASLVEPDRPWRIITSDKMSTVWDGKRTLFDFICYAWKTPPEKCFLRAIKGEEIPPGKYIKVVRASHWSLDPHLKNATETVALLAKVEASRRQQ